MEEAKETEGTGSTEVGNIQNGEGNDSTVKSVKLADLKTTGDLFDLNEVGRIEITFETKDGKSLKKQSIILDQQDLVFSSSADIVNQTASIMHPKKISEAIEFTLKILPVDLEKRYGEFKPKF